MSSNKATRASSKVLGGAAKEISMPSVSGNTGSATSEPDSFRLSIVGCSSQVDSAIVMGSCGDVEVSLVDSWVFDGGRAGSAALASFANSRSP